MEYSVVIKEKLPSILSEVSKNLKNNATFNEFVSSKEEIDLLIKKQEDLITKYLIDFEKGKIDENLCYQFYKDLNIPYAIIYASMSFIKKKLLKELEKEIDDKLKLLEFEE
ncbi:hypothetical protein [Caminibacter sp.]